MSRPDHYLIGVDFGTKSCRVLLIDLDRRQEVAMASAAYDHGVIDQALLGTSLKRGWHCRRRTTTRWHCGVPCRTFLLDRTSIRGASWASASRSPPARSCR